MIRFILRRVLQSAIVLLVFLTFVFFFAQMVMPGDYAIITRWGQGAAVVQAYREELGLDRPLGERYVTWMWGILRGDWGESFGREYNPRTGQVERIPVRPQIVGRALQFTFLVFFTGAVIAFRLGEGLGKGLAWRKSRFLSGVVTVIAIVLYTAFPPLVVFIFTQLNRPINVFYPYRAFDTSIWERHGDWISPIGLIGTVCFYMFSSLVATVLLLGAVNWALNRLFRRQLPTLLYIVLLLGIWFGGWIISGYGPWMLDIARVLTIGVVVVVLLTFGETMLLMRTSMVDTLNEEYILTARAKGLPERVIRDKHAARNALLPVLSRFIINIPYVMAGMIMVEMACRLPTVGTYMFATLDAREIYLFMGALIVLGVTALAARLVLDIVIASIDPRIRLPQSGNPGVVFEGQRMNPLQALASLLSDWRSRLSQGAPAAATRAGESHRHKLSLPERFHVWRRWVAQRLGASWKQAGASWDVFSSNRLAVSGLVIVALFVVMTVAYPILIATVWDVNIYNPVTGFDARVFPHPTPPSLSNGHVLGTDALGRDVLSMLLVSTPTTFIVGLSAAITAAAVGTLIGAITAYNQGGVLDTLFGYLSDVLLAIPIPIVMVIIGSRYFDVMSEGEFGLLYGLMAGLSNVAIMMRSQGLKLMAQPFIEASRVAGAGAGRIIRVHLIPHMLPLAAVQMMLTAASSVIAYAFIGFAAVAEFRTNWGTMIYFALTLTQAVTSDIPWHQLIPPSLALALFASSFYFISRGLHEVAEPRLRER